MRHIGTCVGVSVFVGVGECRGVYQSVNIFHHPRGYLNTTKRPLIKIMHWDKGKSQREDEREKEKVDTKFQTASFFNKKQTTEASVYPFVQLKKIKDINRHKTHQLKWKC